MGIIETQIVFLISALGLYYFVNLAWKERKNSFALKSFFLGGARIGPDLTEQNTIGMTFAWSGGIWFFATIAFAYGPWVLWMQIPWCISIFLLALLFSKIHSVTKNKTIHGFLDESYGKRTRKISALATTFGYVFNTGFEIYWSSMLMCNILNQPELTIWVALVFAIITAVYCSIGGYKANASTDKPQNNLGVFSLTVLALFVVFNTNIPVLKISGIIFGVGSFVYLILSIFFPNLVNTKRAKVLTFLAFLLVAITLLISLWLSSQTGGENISKTFSNIPFSKDLLIGIISFQLLFSIVDMANWQGIAANGDIPDNQHKKLKLALIRSALYLNWFPALGGVLIGLGLRYGFTGVTDSNIFHYAFSTVLIGYPEFLRAVVIGILLLGFISTTLSTADSYLMSAVQTITYDILYHKKVKQLVANDRDEDEERQFVINAKKFLLPVAIVMVLFFWIAYEAYSKIGGNALDFQMIMYSFAISLLPSVAYSLYKGVNIKHRYDNVSFVSILTGIIFSLAPYLYVVLFNSHSPLKSKLVNLTPLFSFFSSLIVFGIGVIIQKIRFKND